MKPLALAAAAALLGLLFAASSSAEEAFASSLRSFTPEALPSVLELGGRLTDPMDREAWAVFRQGIEQAARLRPSPAEAAGGWLTVLAALASAAPSGSPRRARLDFWRRLLPGFGV